MKNSKNEIWKIIDGFGDYHIRILEELKASNGEKKKY